MDSLHKEFQAVFLRKETFLLRKTYFYYFLLFLLILCRIDLMTIHDLRIKYLLGLYHNIPRTGETQVAILLADYAVRLSPKDIGAWVLLAESYKDNGDIARAVYAYEKAIELKPESKKLRLALAGVYAAGGQQEKASAILNSIPVLP